MLDFYLIPAKKTSPDYPDEEQLELVGGLNLTEFDYLSMAKIIDAEYSYFSDFR